MTSLLENRFYEAVAIAFLAAMLASLFTSGSINDDILKVLAASLRMVDGQLPYRDFMPQVVPLANLLAVPAFALLPMIGLAALVLSIILNVTAALLMRALVHQLTGSRGGALIAGTLMAFWYMQIGGYYFDLVAYVFGLAAFTRLSLREDTRAGITEGFLLACAVLSKQSIGVFCAAAFGLVVLAFFGWRALFRWRFLCAFMSLHLVALAYLAVIGGLENFLLYAVHLQSDFAAQEKNLWRLATDFLWPWGIDIITALHERKLGQISFYPVVLTIYLSYAVTFAAIRRGLASRRLLAGYVFLLLSTVWAAATPGRLYTQVTFGFAGIAAITLTLSFYLLQHAKHPRLATSFLAMIMIGLVGIPLLQAIRNNFDGNRRQISPLNAARLWPLTFNPQQVQAIEAAGVVATTGKSYALLGGTFLNAIPLALGRAPLDPLLFYENITMIPRDEALRRKWEAMMIRELERRSPEFLLTGFIPEDFPHDHFTLTSMASFPLLKSYVEDRYPTIVTSGALVTLHARQ